LWKYENFSLIFHIFVQNRFQAGPEQQVNKMQQVNKIYKNSKTEKKRRKIFYYFLKLNSFLKFEERF